MSSTSRGKPAKPAKAYKIVKPKQNSKHTTAHTRNYRWKSFNERISNLKIDPIRRKRFVEQEEKAVEGSHTFFGESLQEWRDTNLSATFTAFAKEAAPLCDNLAVVLHNEDMIMDVLVAYIERADALAMEPLLNLLSHFAHDLDTRFEKHFQRAVATVTAVAAKHSDHAVIEWSFSCLAWLYKYLSRLLTPDLRPLYDLMAPYLGKEQQRPFVVRFAAESLSFLVRKAAMIYERDSGPLDLVVGHMLRDCEATKEDDTANLHQQGIMTLITEAVKGVQHGVHAGGIPVLQSLLKHSTAIIDDNESVVQQIVAGVLTSLNHWCNAAGFEPIQDLLIVHASASTTSNSASSIRLAANALFTAVSVRKGTRIRAWVKMMDVTKALIDACDGLRLVDNSTHACVLGLLAVVMQTASIDAIISTGKTIEKLRGGQWKPYFPQFCDMFMRLGMNNRFEQFVLPHLQRHIADNDIAEDVQLLTLVAQLGKNKPDLKFTCSASTMQNSFLLLETIASSPSTASFDAVAQANLFLAVAPFLSFDEAQKRRLHSNMHQLTVSALQNDGQIQAIVRDFTLSSAFGLLLKLDVGSLDLDDLWVPLCDLSPQLVGLPDFWSSLLQFIKIVKPRSLSGSHTERLQSALTVCVASPSHRLRQDALDILQEIYRSREMEIPEVLSIAITIESIPLGLETARSISMNIRRLPKTYTNTVDDVLMVKAIPSFCFGLLYLKLAQAWDDAANALAEMCETKPGEEAVIELAQSWIGAPPEEDKDDDTVPPMVDNDTDGFRVLSDFECPNLAKWSAIREQVFVEQFSGYPSPSQRLGNDNRHIPALTASSRSQALAILNKIPSIAEKRSRVLVPILLRWAGPSDSESTKAEQSTSRWSRKDQKALLAIFAQFTNPRVLYRSSEVFDALLALCANGDVEIQKSALKALLAWKDKSVVRYAEHLNNLLDEARFREELSVFLQEDTEDEEADEVEGIRAEDYASLMPVLLRLLYGRAVAGGKEGQAGRRKALFVALSRFGETTLQEFLKIAFGPLSNDAGVVSEKPQAPLRQQLGLLNMLNDMLEVLGAELQPFIAIILDGVLACTITATHKLEDAEVADQSLLRSVRQTGMQCIVKVFASVEQIPEQQRYCTTIIDELIKPRLDAFASENAQSVSSVLRLYAAWSSSSETAEAFAKSEPTILQRVAELLESEHTKDDVRLYVLHDILDNLTGDEVDSAVFQPHVSGFVRAIGAVLARQPSKEILDACVQSFSRLAARIVSQDEATQVIAVCTDLLKRPSNAVSPHAKSGLLHTILPLVGNFRIDAQEDLYSALCALYSRLADPESRVLLSRVLATLVREDEGLLEVAKTCEDMNAMGSRLDEPDHDRREQAFTKVYQTADAMSLAQWVPLVHNFLFYIRDNEDRVNRSSASHALQLFVKAAAGHSTETSWSALLESAVLAGIERGVRDSRSTELVLAEYMLVTGSMVENLPNWPRVSDLQSLAVGGDEEASFFNNVLHIQQHRRLRAMRRAAEEAGTVSSQNVSRILLPLLEHFIFDQAEGDAGRALADQAVQTIGALAKSLNKSAFRATFQRYMAHLKAKDEEEDLQKKALRLLNTMVDGLTSESNQVSAAIVRELLPPLLQYLHQKDESTVDRRMPVAVTVVRLMKAALPEEEFSSKFPGVLLDVCHVLRSRSQEARDQTRKALTSISKLVGPFYFGFLVRELRSALKRGYQLHVLSFTVHALLVDSGFQPGDLDEVLSDVMLVIMDDIFGITGQEKDAEEYKSGMKEVKASKSFDTMELLARITPIRKLGELLRPIRNLLSERLDLKRAKKIDELLGRFRKGLDHNPASESRDMLVFCYEIVSQVYAEDAAVAQGNEELDDRRKRYLIQPEPEKKKKDAKGSTASYRFKLVSFALNLLRKIIRRHSDLQTPQNMAGFLGMAGDGLVQGQEEVKLAAVRFLSTIMRVDMAKLEKNASLYVKEAVNMIKGASDMTMDSAKAALELLTSVLREKRSVEVKEAHIALVLKRVKADIDEPDRQNIVYKFLKAVMGRKIVITEVYEVMDEVGKVMITNPTREIRESARSAYHQFIMDFPQGKGRWQKQTSFLVGNLQYEHAEGRKSVMEFLNQMLGKVGDDVLEEQGPRIFVSLLPILVSDEDQACRDMARLLLGKLFELASDQAMTKYLGMMETWSQSEKKPSVRAGALQCWTVLLRARQLPPKQLEDLRDKLEHIVADCTAEDAVVDPQLALDALLTLSALVETAPTVAFAKTSSNLWKGLQDLETTGDQHIDEAAASLLGAFYTDFASTSSKAGGLGDLPLRGSGGIELGAGDMRKLTLVGLRALRGVQLSSSESLTAQIVRNLVFLGRCFAANEMPWYNNFGHTPAESEDEDSSPDDNEQQQINDKSALAYLLRRLSSMLMADKFSVISRTAALQCEAALINQLIEILNLKVVLRPLHGLTDPSVPKPPGELHQNLSQKAHELLDVIQKKVGSQKYLSALASVRTEAKARREERRQKRRIDAVSAPEKWAKDKQRKYEAKRTKKKEKGHEARGQRRGW